MNKRLREDVKMLIVRGESVKNLFINSVGGLCCWSDNIVRYFSRLRKKC